MAKDKSSGVADTARPSSRSRPAVGSQVTIQSEQEKQLKKMYRKEEKKVAKQVRDLKSVGVTDRATQLQMLGYDPSELKKERYACGVRTCYSRDSKNTSGHKYMA